LTLQAGTAYKPLASIDSVVGTAETRVEEAT
jgi:hypothetical protein